MERITIFDTTLRDGEQSPGCSMNIHEKLRMAQTLDALGVDVIEAGFPIASQGDFAAVEQIAREIRRPTVAALARCKREDVESAWAAVRDAERPRIHTFLATSDIHLEFKLKITRAEALQQTQEVVSLAKSRCDDIEFSPEDATRSDFDFLCEVLETAIESGATTLNIPDTVGYTLPAEYGALIANLCKKVSNVDKAVVSVHCHDDLGLAVANTLAGIEAGARQVECTINGIGERAGNAPLEEIVMAMRVRADRMQYQTGIESKLLYAASQQLAGMISFGPQPNKPVVGANAFAHAAGIHQHGMLSNPLCYEIMTPESVGAPGTKLVLGKHSGRHALQARYGELGYRLSPAEVKEIYARFIELADRKKNIYDQDLLSLLPIERRSARASAPVTNVGAPSVS
ncbi:MAG TPA: 2-isopropylmalate synthase [Terriglobales bacterium]|jgi:2-isopropylmalate synthase|nr:2-isopropylmalate synthase [Terriglobales bacterium]